MVKKITTFYFLNLLSKLVILETAFDGNSLTFDNFRFLLKSEKFSFLFCSRERKILQIKKSKNLLFIPNVINRLELQASKHSRLRNLLF